MQKPLAGLNVAILVANGFHEIEMTTFQRALLEAGAAPKIISVESSLAKAGVTTTRLINTSQTLWRLIMMYCSCRAVTAVTKN